MNVMLLFGVGVTVLLVLFVGMYVGRKVEGDSQNFLVAGRMLPIYLVAPALMVAAVDSNATVGNMDLSSSAGFWAGASLAIGLAIALFLSGIFIAKPMNEMGLFSLGDFFRVKYGPAFEKLASCIMILAYIILLAGNLVACGYLFEYFLGLPYVAGLFITGGLVLLYTLCGGLLSDAYTAAIQTAITLIASIVIAVFVGVTYGFSVPEGFGPFDFEQLTTSEAGAPHQLGDAAFARCGRHRGHRLPAAHLQREEFQGCAQRLLRRSGSGSLRRRAVRHDCAHLCADPRA